MSKEIGIDKELWEKYSPKPNPWFSNDITYEGWGIASFDNPLGTIEGKTIVTVDETGKLDVVMEAQELKTDVLIHGTGDFRFQKFLQADFSKSDGVAFLGVNNINPCSELIIKTENGTFTSDGNIFHSQGFAVDSKITFFLSRGIFTTENDEMAKYWVVPLINFLSTFHRHSHPKLTQHPLRLYLTPIIPDIADEKKKQTAWLAANQANNLISFYFGDSIGYIQPILEYRNKKEALESREYDKCITALMISDVTDDLDENSFPYDYINLISLANGIKVGAAWVEYRDMFGNLVSRQHIHQIECVYKKGYAVIDETIHSGLGKLLSLASNSSEFQESYFGALISQMTRLQSNSRHVEDQMDLLCRSLDTLCEEFGISVKNLAKSLPDEYQSEINRIISNARVEVQELEKSTNAEIAPVLQQIANRIENAKNIDRPFGLAVIDLLEKYKLPDKEIMEKFYSSYSEIENTSWARTLSKYRGAAMHSGYFAKEKFDIYDIAILEDHLHDILVRIVLKILGYDGEYQPRVIRHTVDGKTIDWVNENTQAFELGYKAPII